MLSLFLLVPLEAVVPAREADLIEAVSSMLSVVIRLRVLRGVSREWG